MDVERIDDWQFSVKSGAGFYNVDLELRTCSCGVFDVEKIPCSHAIAAINDARLLVSSYVSPAYNKLLSTLPMRISSILQHQTFHSLKRNLVSPLSLHRHPAGKRNEGGKLG
ncbi:unnamed protein product [Microthlaspi erraticum]|uniref:SWIM-type domain-containing protein n=1 Tax=Microthlaspi erraticum TaxID=1685480 RepID=A0A6D2L2T1_9BRAS|nr:unnamed protein product [Microthlaspi erraticum]